LDGHRAGGGGRTVSVDSTPTMETPRKKILFLTGTRADFGKLKPLIEQVEACPLFEASLFVTGMHMLSRYGYTLEEIQKAGFKKLFTYINQIESASAQMDLVLANTIQGLAYYVRECPPDLIVIHGDRVEALAGAIVGSLNNILVAHFEGGELSGTIDELIRHSVSKLSHLHFVANEEARTRLRQMGEAPDSIFVVGSPDIDVMLSDRLPSLEEAQQRYGLPFPEYSIFLYHPVTTELPALRRNIAATVEALRTSGRKFLVIYPNNDSGSDVILEHILPLKEDPSFRVLPSLRFEYFLTLLRHADAIVGNSSAGIREAPVYGVPTVNIGSRQLNRYTHVSIKNVPEDSDALRKALHVIPPKYPPSLHFGSGTSAKLFLHEVANGNVWRIRAQKQFCDI
jgi:UDP-N-acetylglucosamine 2-epimerase (hydrolysing)